MIRPAPAEATCPQHPDRAAVWICPRCGSFFCQVCERRTRPDAVPMCPGCWTIRSEQVGQPKPEGSGTGLQTASLVLGILSLLPIPVLQLSAAAVGIVALVLAKSPEQKRVRWRPIVGLVCVALGFALEAAGIALLALKD